MAQVSSSESLLERVHPFRDEGEGRGERAQPWSLLHHLPIKVLATLPTEKAGVWLACSFSKAPWPEPCSL